MPTSNTTLRWRHNDHAGVSNHQPHGCLLNRLFRRKSKKTSKLRVTGLCAGNSPGTGEFPAQMASYAENVSISWRHHGISFLNFIMTNCDPRCLNWLGQFYTSLLGGKMTCNFKMAIVYLRHCKCMLYFNYSDEAIPMTEFAPHSILWDGVACLRLWCLLLAPVTSYTCMNISTIACACQCNSAYLSMFLCVHTCLYIFRMF